MSASSASSSGGRSNNNSRCNGRAPRDMYDVKPSSHIMNALTKQAGDQYEDFSQVKENDIPMAQQKQEKVQGEELKKEQQEKANMTKIKTCLIKFYLKHNQENNDYVDTILKDYHGRENDLNEKLKSKYGEGFLPSQVQGQPFPPGYPPPLAPTMFPHMLPASCTPMAPHMYQPHYQTMATPGWLLMAAPYGLPMVQPMAPSMFPQTYPLMALPGWLPMCPMDVLPMHHEAQDENEGNEEDGHENEDYDEAYMVPQVGDFHEGGQESMTLHIIPHDA